jgi:catechol 2,3-dioxygenase-like lactoylglutathione lyase family enzyme
MRCHTECLRFQAGRSRLRAVSRLPSERLTLGVSVGSIVIRCARFDEMLAFWQAALGYVPREAARDGWVVLTDPTGAGPNISLDQVEASIAPQPDELSALHLDLYADDQHAEVERLLALGATRHPHETPPDADFVVLVDPDGYRFCVVQT